MNRVEAIKGRVPNDYIRVQRNYVRLAIIYHHRIDVVWAWQSSIRLSYEDLTDGHCFEIDISSLIVDTYPQTPRD